jgi:hypothetical protein
MQEAKGEGGGLCPMGNLMLSWRIGIPANCKTMPQLLWHKASFRIAKRQHLTRPCARHLSLLIPVAAEPRALCISIQAQ